MEDRPSVDNLRVRVALTLTIVLCFGAAGGAQERSEHNGTSSKKVTVEGGADMVSTFVWRGIYCAPASIQPGVTVTAGTFGFEAWGTTPFAGNGAKEVDLSLYFETGGFRVGVTDYWWPGEESFRYFCYKKEVTDHLFEGSLSYTLPFEKFPLTISWNTLFYGSDFKENGKRNYSSYIELNYPFMVMGVDMGLSAGALPWASPLLMPNDRNGFSICNLMISAAKELPITDKFSLPLFTQLIFNPTLGDAFFIFGLSLRFN